MQSVNEAAARPLRSRVRWRSNVPAELSKPVTARSAAHVVTPVAVGAAERVRDISGLPLFPQWSGAHDACLQRLDKIIGAAEATHEREVGAGLPVDDLTKPLPPS